MIGKLRSVVVDGKDPLGLATFYAGVLGGTVDKEEDSDSWVVLTDPQARRLAFQYSPKREVLALGASRVTDAGGDFFRVFRDPAGHTFCLVWGIDE